MRILLTGGAGCLGSNLTERYLEAGDDVFIIDNFATGQRGSLPSSHPRMTLVEGSVTDRPLVAYPNGGDRWDATVRHWIADDAAGEFDGSRMAHILLIC